MEDPLILLHGPTSVVPRVRWRCPWNFCFGSVQGIWQWYKHPLRLWFKIESTHGRRVNHFRLKPQSLWGFGVSSQILGLARSLPCSYHTQWMASWMCEPSCNSSKKYSNLWGTFFGLKLPSASSCSSTSLNCLYDPCSHWFEKPLHWLRFKILAILARLSRSKLQQPALISDPYLKMYVLYDSNGPTWPIPSLKHSFP